MKFLCIISMVLLGLGCEAQKDTASKIYNIVEQMPEFPGGDAEFFKFLEKNLHPPTIQNDNEVIGKILVRFVIDTDGSVTDVTLLRIQNLAWENEMKRVLALCPKFKPGRQDGKAVKVYFNLPIVDPYGTRF
jgi:TonB-like protein